MYLGGLSDDMNWQEVTYLPTSGQAGQDTYVNRPTYFDPSWDQAWLAGIGFTSNPMLGRHKIDVPQVQVGYGEQSSMGPGPLPDGWVWHDGGQTVSGGDPPWVEWTPVRQWEKDKGYRQQYYWTGDQRYARYVDSAGNQVGPIVQTYKESKITKIIGKVVQAVATVAVAAGAVQAAAAVAASAAGSGTAAGAGAATPAAGAAVPESVGVVGSGTAAAAAPSAIAPIASAVAPSVATGGAVTGALTSAASVVPTVLKAIPAVSGVIKAVQAVQGRENQVAALQQQMPIAPPASMVSPSGNALGPTAYDPTIFQPQQPSWLIPAAIIGGGVILVAMLGHRKSPGTRRPQRRTSRR